MPFLALLATMPLSVFICVVLAFGPLTYGSLTPGASFHDNQRILQVLLLVVCVPVLAWRVRAARALAPKVPDLVIGLMTLFFLFGLASSALAYSPRHALTEWGCFWLLLLAATGVAGEVGAQRLPADDRLRRVLTLAAIACAVYIVQALTVYVNSLIGRVQPAEQALTPGFDHFRFLNHAQTIGLPLLGLLVIMTTRSLQRRGWWAVCALWWMLLFVSGGRGTVVAVAAAVLVVCLIWRKSAWTWGRVMVSTACAGFAAYLLIYVVPPAALGLHAYGFLPQMAERTAQNPASGRLDLWAHAWASIVQHPWLGTGPMHFAHLARDVQTNAHPHNWMLQLAFEWGVPALLCVVAAGLVIVHHVWRRDVSLRTPGAEAQRSILAALCGACLAALIDGLVSGSIVMPLAQLWLALLLGCLWGWLGAWQKNTLARPVWLVMICGGAVATVLVVLGSFPEVLNIPAHEAPYRPPLRAFFAPRWWRNGYF